MQCSSDASHCSRLPLLADAVLSKLAVEHSERLSWERVLTALSRIVGNCNEAARLAERRNEMEALARYVLRVYRG